MKILIVHNTLNDSFSVSGVLKHYALMAREWIAQGHATDFMVAAAGYPQLQDLVPEAGRVCSDRWFNASRYLTRTWRYLPAYGWRLANVYWRRLPRGYDVVYASSLLLFEVLPACVIARRLGCPWVVKAQHVLHAQAKRQGFFDRLFLKTEVWSAGLANRGAREILCLSRVVAGDYRRLELGVGLKPRDTRVIGTGLDIASLPVGPETAKEFDLAVLGRIHEQKGIFELPGVWRRVLRRVPAAKLILIGEGPHREAVRRRFVEMGLLGSVTLAGGVKESLKNELVARSRIGLSLSYEEGWGLSVNEFLGIGLPVVAYELPVFREVFSDQLVLVVQGDQEGAANAVVSLLRAPDRQMALARQARVFGARFDYRKIALQELELLHRVVRRDSGGAGSPATTDRGGG